MSEKIKIVRSNYESDFVEEVNCLLNKGYEISSSNCSCFKVSDEWYSIGDGPKMLELQEVYQAILIKN